MMAWIASILALVMTWTVESKTSVSGDGDVPPGVVADYYSSYQKNQVRAGDRAQLSLSALNGICVEQVELYMRSNKSSGAGNITVSADGETIAGLSGTYKEWTGAYDNSAYHPVTVFTGAAENVDELTVTVDGTDNSLYVDRFVISYRAAEARTVTLMEGNQLHSVLAETYGGSGVLLPRLAHRDGLHFCGWTETAFFTVTDAPDILLPEQRYFPQSDITLWSVWMYAGRQDTVLLTELQSGEYIYLNRVTQMALAGTPEDGKMTPEPLSLSALNQRYYIDFLPEGTATIKHAATNTYIGYDGQKLAAAPSEWLVYHEGDQTLFYTMVNNAVYVLWLNVLDSYGNMYAGLVRATGLDSPMALCLPAENDDEPAYTCFPEYGEDIPDVIIPDAQEVIVPIGIYKLRIRNGKKYMYL